MGFNSGFKGLIAAAAAAAAAAANLTGHMRQAGRCANTYAVHY